MIFIFPYSGQHGQIKKTNSSKNRFDAVINTFCGGDVSGVQDITPHELDAVRRRMLNILDSVHFDTN